MVALFFVLTIIVFLTADYVVQRVEMRSARSTPAPHEGHAPAAAPAAEPPAQPATERARPARLDDVPGGLFVGAGHTWARLEPDGELVLGADGLAGALLGAPERVALLAAGTRVREGDALARLERDGRAITLRAPADGEILAANALAEASPHVLAGDPYRRGWLYQFAPASLPAVVRSHRVGEDARAWLAGELSRVRDTLADALARRASAAALATLPDGGIPSGASAAALDDASWKALTRSVFGAIEPEPAEP